METTARLDKLIKVLAMVDSTHEGEALAALRQARQLLFQSGLNFADLAESVLYAPEPKTKRHEIDISRGLIKAYEQRIKRLELEKQSLQQDLILAERAISRWRELAEASGRDCSKHQAAADKWRLLARNTANHLWELGQQLHELDGTPSDQLDGHKSAAEPETDVNVINFTKPAR